MSPFPSRSSTFGERALANHLLFGSVAIVVLGWSVLTSPDGMSARFTQESFAVLAKFIDYKQVGIPVAGALLLYLVISILSHQSRSLSSEEVAHHWRELLHGEVSSILLSSASLSLVVGGLFCWSGLWSEGLRTAAWWPMGFFLSYALRPKSQDRYAF